MRWALRAFAVAAMIVTAGMASPALSQAGTYTVHICDGISGNRVNSVAFGSNGPNAAYSACPTDASGHRIGLVAHSGINAGTSGWLTGAWATFGAPAGATISSVSGHLAGKGVQGFGSSFQSSTDDFASQQTVLTNCVTSFCAMGGPDGGSPVSYSTPGATAVRLLTLCGAIGGCSTAATPGWPYAAGWTSMGDMQIEISDSTAPSLSSIRGSAWAEGSWHRGNESIGFDARDNTGIQRYYVQVDSDAFPVDERPGCDYSYAAPCWNQSFNAPLDTATFSDGHHVLTLAAQDAAGNWNEARTGLDVDNHAPDNPTGVAVAGGESAWHSTNSFDVSWTNPGGQAAPIVRAHYTVYDGAGNPVADGTRGGTQLTSINGLTVPAPGDYTFKVYLEDAAGNMSPATASDPVHLKFDDLAPGLAEPQHRNGWVDAAQARGYWQHIRGPLASEVPVSGIRGYAITTDGSNPGDSPQVSANSARGYEADASLGDLREGVTQFKARAISGAGIPSSAVGREDIHVDLTSPLLAIVGVPESSDWTRDPVALQITATDPGDLSGMAGAEAFDPRDTDGAYITHSIDGGPRGNVRGPAQPIDADGIRGHESTAFASVRIDTDGRHTVTYSATDVAGNESGERSVTVKVDRTAPEFVVFEAQDPEDPRLMNVAASDATSGLADGGKIQLRRITPSRGDWITLRTSREGQRYYAHVDNDELPAGDYEFRAAVPDQAGNVALGDRNRRGEQEILYIDPTHVGTYRTGPDVGGVTAADQGATVGTRLTARAVVARKPAKKCKRSKGGTQRRCVKVPANKRETLVRSLRVPHGKRAATRGTLTTSDGRPIAGAEITVLSRPSSDGARYTAQSAVRTNSAGKFEYTAPAGPSRTLDFAYRGNATYKHADGFVTLRVPAYATLKSTRRAVRNGGSVGFAGKVVGKPYPTKGKIVDLQAFYRKKWRTFATARASRSGKWRFRYRFGATRGTVAYRFRVRVRASSDYPYELGYSRVVRVTVSG